MTTPFHPIKSESTPRTFDSDCSDFRCFLRPAISKVQGHIINPPFRGGLYARTFASIVGACRGFDIFTAARTFALGRKWGITRYQLPKINQKKLHLPVDRILGVCNNLSQMKKAKKATMKHNTTIKQPRPYSRPQSAMLESCLSSSSDSTLAGASSFLATSKLMGGIR